MYASHTIQYYILRAAIIILQLQDVAFDLLIELVYASCLCHLVATHIHSHPRPDPIELVYSISNYSVIYCK